MISLTRDPRSEFHMEDMPMFQMQVLLLTMAPFEVRAQRNRATWATTQFVVAGDVQ